MAFLAWIVAFLPVFETLAYPTYRLGIPNGFYVPMDSDESICKTFGHGTCSTDPDKGNVNAFGDLFKSERNEWTQTMCMADSDGDGYTNGDELGDPCCVWSQGSTPTRAAPQISDPSDPSRVPGFPSCKLSGAPNSISSLNLMTADADRATLSFAASSSCVCSYYVTLTNTLSSITQTLGPFSATTNAVTLCSLAASTPYTASLSAANLAGNSSSSAAVAFTTAATPLSTTTACTAAATAAPTKIASVPETGDKLFLIAGIGLVLFLLAVFVFGRVTHSASYKGAPWAVKLKSSPLFRRGQTVSRVWFVDSLLGMSRFDAVLLALYICLMVACYIAYLNLFKGDIGVPYRAFGPLALMNLFLLVLPATRHSVLRIAMGMSYEKTIVYHRILGQLTVLFLLLHAFGLLDAYSNVFVGAKFTLRWSSIDYHNNLSGWIVLFSLVPLALLALSFVRRRQWEWFKSGHLLAFVLVVFACIHMSQSIPVFVVAGVLWGLDVGLRCYQWSAEWRLIDVTQCAGNVCRVQLKLVSSREIGYTPGQYALLMFPTISSLQQHPFSIVSSSVQRNCDVSALVKYTKITLRRDDTITFLIKQHHKTSFTGSITTLPLHSKVILEGFYGSSHVNLNNYTNVILIGGGVGITPIYNIFEALVSASSSGQGERRVELIWSVKSAASVGWFDNDLERLASRVGVFVSVYTSQFERPVQMELPVVNGRTLRLRTEPVVNREENSAADAVEGTPLNRAEPVPELSRYVKVLAGRPNIQALLQTVQDAYPDRRTCVICCGPDSLIRAAENAVLLVSRAAKSPIAFYKETFFL